MCGARSAPQIWTVIVHVKMFGLGFSASALHRSNYWRPSRRTIVVVHVGDVFCTGSSCDLRARQRGRCEISPSGAQACSTWCRVRVRPQAWNSGVQGEGHSHHKRRTREVPQRWVFGRHKGEQGSERDTHQRVCGPRSAGFGGYRPGIALADGGSYRRHGAPPEAYHSVLGITAT